MVATSAGSSSKRRVCRQAWCFRSRGAIAKDQGTSVYRVIVTRSGTLAGPMHLVRSSGYADFDAAARAAIRNAAPFAPLPVELMQDNEELAILIPIAFANPMVE